MSSNIIINDIRKHRFSQNERFVFDTNVFMSIFGPYCRKRGGSYEYSGALRDMQINKAHIFLNTIIISEFINAFSHEIWKNSPEGAKYQEFKEYRNSPDFKEVAEEIGLWMEEFLDMVVCSEPDFDSKIAQEYMNRYLAGSLDFNDIVISNFCKTKKSILVTHDFDFRNCSDISVLTANNKLKI